MATSRFMVCIHDVTPAYARETGAMLDGLAPLVGRRLTLGVVPNWHGAWPLDDHPDYCSLIHGSADELILHGCFHKRQKGAGPVSFLTERSDELNGLSSVETRSLIARGQAMFSEAFGRPARGFLAPAWQVGRFRLREVSSHQLEYALGYSVLETVAGRSTRLETFTWDCGRWAWLGHVGHRIGSLSRLLTSGVPTLAIHPRDIERGFWPEIVHVIQGLLDDGFEPCSAADLADAEITA